MKFDTFIIFTATKIISIFFILSCNKIKFPRVTISEPKKNERREDNLQLPALFIIYPNKGVLKMKNTIFLSLIVSIFTVLTSGMAFANWSTSIIAEGQKIQGQYKAHVTIGEGLDEIKTPAPPKAPYYSCAISLIPLPSWTPYLSKDIQNAGSESNMWIIAVNPHGNMSGFDDSITTIHWDASHLGKGNFKLLQGHDESGEVLISDMKTVTSFDVSGWDQNLYFTIIQEKDEE